VSERTEKSFEFDFAVSYASPDAEFVSEVVQSMKGRGLRVFFAPDEQAQIIGGNLIDFLTEVYLKKARYCLVFISRHYVERVFPNRVERPAAQARAIEQSERYIIPVRIDDTEIPGITQFVAYARNDSPTQIADLAVSMLLRDQRPYVARKDKNAHHLTMRAISPTEFDRDRLVDSFQPFRNIALFQASSIPVELYIPSFLSETLAEYKRILESPEFGELDEGTQRQVSDTMMSIEMALTDELLRVPASVLIASQPDSGSGLSLTEAAVDLIESYVLSTIVAVARALASTQLRGFAPVPWRAQFGDCAPEFSPKLLSGLAWMRRADGSERFLWLDADIVEWGPGSFDEIRINLPSKMVIRRKGPYAAEDILRFVAPQLLERQIKGRLPSLLSDAFRYPERMGISERNEHVLEVQNFQRMDINHSGPARRSIEGLRDDIVGQVGSDVLSPVDGYIMLGKADRIFEGTGLFDEAIRQINPKLG
jgi:TIR domain